MSKEQGRHLIIGAYSIRNFEGREMSFTSFRMVTEENGVQDVAFRQFLSYTGSVFSAMIIFFLILRMQDVDMFFNQKQ